MLPLQCVPMRAALLLALAASGTARAADAPELAARRLIAWHVAQDVVALPTPAQLDSADDLLATELRRLFAAAHARDARCARATPADFKPDLWQGDWLIGSVDAFTTVARVDVLCATRQGRAARVHVEWSWVPEHSTTRYGWSADLLLRRHGIAWQLADVIYADGAHLLDHLRVHPREACASAGP